MGVCGEFLLLGLYSLKGLAEVRLLSKLFVITVRRVWLGRFRITAIENAWRAPKIDSFG